MRGGKEYFADRVVVLLVRGTSRVREVAVRSALGAARRRLMRQFVVETGVVAALGGALGVLTSLAIVRLLVALAPPDVPRLASAGLAEAGVARDAGQTIRSVISETA